MSNMDAASINKIKDLVARQDFRSALKEMKSVDTEHETDPEIMMLYAQVYTENKQFEKARKILIDAHIKNPESSRVISELIELYLKMGYFTKAKQYYKIYTAVAPTEGIEAQTVLYDMKKAMQMPDAELIELLKSICDKEYVDKWAFELALLYRKAGMNEESVKECDKISSTFAQSNIYYKWARPLKMGSINVNKAFNCYPKEEVPEQTGSIYQSVQAENEQLKKDYLEHFGNEATEAQNFQSEDDSVIVEDVDDDAISVDAQITDTVDSRPHMSGSTDDVEVEIVEGGVAEDAYDGDKQGDNDGKPWMLEEDTVAARQEEADENSGEVADVAAALGRTAKKVERQEKAESAVRDEESQDANEAARKLAEGFDNEGEDSQSTQNTEVGLNAGAEVHETTEESKPWEKTKPDQPESDYSAEKQTDTESREPETRPEAGKEDSEPEFISFDDDEEEKEAESAPANEAETSEKEAGAKAPETTQSDKEDDDIELFSFDDEDDEDEDDGIGALLMRAAAEEKQEEEQASDESSDDDIEVFNLDDLEDDEEPAEEEKTEPAEVPESAGSPEDTGSAPAEPVVDDEAGENHEEKPEEQEPAGVTQDSTQESESSEPSESEPVSEQAEAEESDSETEKADSQTSAVNEDREPAEVNLEQEDDSGPGSADTTESSADTGQDTEVTEKGPDEVPPDSDQKPDTGEDESDDMVFLDLGGDDEEEEQDSGSPAQQPEEESNFNEDYAEDEFDMADGENKPKLSLKLAGGGTSGGGGGMNRSSFAGGRARGMGGAILSKEEQEFNAMYDAKQEERERAAKERAIAAKERIAREKEQAREAEARQQMEAAEAARRAEREAAEAARRQAEENERLAEERRRAEAEAAEAAKRQAEENERLAEERRRAEAAERARAEEEARAAEARRREEQEQRQREEAEARKLAEERAKREAETAAQKAEEERVAALEAERIRRQEEEKLREEEEKKKAAAMAEQRKLQQSAHNARNKQDQELEDAVAAIRAKVQAERAAKEAKKKKEQDILDSNERNRIKKMPNWQRKTVNPERLKQLGLAIDEDGNLVDPAAQAQAEAAAESAEQAAENQRADKQDTDVQPAEAETAAVETENAESQQADAGINPGREDAPEQVITPGRQDEGESINIPAAEETLQNTGLTGETLADAGLTGEKLDTTGHSEITLENAAFAGGSLVHDEDFETPEAGVSETAEDNSAEETGSLEENQEVSAESQTAEAENEEKPLDQESADALDAEVVEEVTGEAVPEDGDVIELSSEETDASPASEAAPGVIQLGTDDSVDETAVQDVTEEVEAREEAQTEETSETETPEAAADNTEDQTAGVTSAEAEEIEEQETESAVSQEPGGPAEETADEKVQPAAESEEVQSPDNQTAETAEKVETVEAEAAADESAQTEAETKQQEASEPEPARVEPETEEAPESHNAGQAEEPAKPQITVINGVEFNSDGIPLVAQKHIGKYAASSAVRKQFRKLIPKIVKKQGIYRNIVIVGRKGCSVSNVAIDFARTYHDLGLCRTKVVATIKARVLNKTSIDRILPKLKGGCLIVDKAGDLSEEKALEVFNMVNDVSNDIVLMLVGEVISVTEMFQRSKELNSLFHELFQFHDLSDIDLADIAQAHLAEKNYQISDDGLRAMKDRIASMEFNGIDDVLAMVDAAIAKAEKRAQDNLSDVVRLDDYEDSGLNTLREFDFE